MFFKDISVFFFCRDSLDFMDWLEHATRGKVQEKWHDAKGNRVEIQQLLDEKKVYECMQ